MALAPRLAVDGGDEAVPDGDVIALLGRVADQLRVLGQGLGRVLGEVREGDHRVAVLARVVRELLAS